MAEQPKNFSQKAGYQGLLDFDPVNGILKYGSYEAFAKDMGVAPKREEFDFNDYLQALQPGVSASIAGTMTPKMRQQYMDRFMNDLQAGRIYYGQQSGSLPGGAPSKPQLIVQDAAPAFGTVNMNPITQYQSAPRNAARNVVNLGGDKFAVDTYDIPNNVDFINKFTERAVGATRQDNALLRQNQQDAVLRRQGAASTVLSK